MPLGGVLDLSVPGGSGEYYSLEQRVGVNWERQYMVDTQSGSVVRTEELESVGTTLALSGIETDKIDLPPDFGPGEARVCFATTAICAEFEVQ